MQWALQIALLVVAVISGILGFGILTDIPAAVMQLVCIIASLAFLTATVFSNRRPLCRYPRAHEPWCR
jgi:uncharacterized membrane protein YtjA (UPF0391 family)